ncbi:MAG TPA: (Fe-S)-binding protein [Fibrobacteria bacterium]|nr:(Fe-S)-binding protein [Fibrobacteria bacterium]
MISIVSGHTLILASSAATEGLRLDTVPSSSRFVQSLRKNLNREHVAALESCLDCGQCGSACAWYLATGNPQLHPRRKTGFLRRIQRRYLRPWSPLLEKAGLLRPPSEAALREEMASFWKCTTCGRCTMACPLGISNRKLVRLGRRAFVEAGFARENPVLRQIEEGSRGQRHSFGVPRERTQLRIAFHFQASGVQVPLDVEGAEYLLLCTAVGNTRIPHLGIKIPMLLNAAGVSYTASRRILDTGTEAEFVIVHEELSRAMLLDVEEEALRLGVSTLLVPECGCDTRTFFQDAGNILGRPLRVGVRTLDSLLLEQLRSNRLPFQAVRDRLTLHDPCKVTRLSGLGEESRQILSLIASDFVEMTPNREHNYCCNGGSGPLRLPENDGLRRDVSVLKARQIRATGAKRVATPCAVCMLTLADIAEHHQLAPDGERMSFLLFEIVFEAVDEALAARGERDRFRLPRALRDRSEAFLAAHGVEGLAAENLRDPRIAVQALAWLREDGQVGRLGQTDHRAAALLERWERQVAEIAG